MEKEGGGEEEEEGRKEGEDGGFVRSVFALFRIATLLRKINKLLSQTGESAREQSPDIDISGRDKYSGIRAELLQIREPSIFGCRRRPPISFPFPPGPVRFVMQNYSFSVARSLLMILCQRQRKKNRACL